MKFREFIIENGTKILLGKNEDSNDELVKEFKGKRNIILHTKASGSPFCAILKMDPSKEEIYSAGIFCARYSQDWRDNKGDVVVDVFTGKDVEKLETMKKGTWRVKKTKKIKVKKEDILKLLK